MRADRLLAILLLLQRGGRMTAGELARRLEVSERTIYRDLEALGGAGVPVYAEPGRGGGIRLVEGYRTDLSGLSLTEAELVPLLGLSDIFAGIAVGGALRRAETKVLMALPDDQRVRAEQARRRIHVDLSRWWEEAEEVPLLTRCVEAVFGSRRLHIAYTRPDREAVERTLDPLGLVVQGGVWYLVASVDGSEPRIYRVSRISGADVLDEHATVPDDFDLLGFWSARKEEFHMTRQGYEVSVRARPWVVRATDPQINVDTGAEWVDTTLSFGTRGMAFRHLLSYGANVVVLEPADLREEIATAARATADVYSR